MKKITTLLLLFFSTMITAECVHANPEINNRDTYYDLFHMEIDTPGRSKRYKNDKYLRDQFSRSVVTRSEWMQNELVIRRESKDYRYDRRPVVLELLFHMLYTDDISVAAREIGIQLQALNRDFGPPKIPASDHHDPDGAYRDRATDTGIRFKLSPLMEGGMAIAESKSDSWRDYNEMKAKERGSPPVDPGGTVNIWVIDSDEEIGSYAQYPGGPEGTDGIVIDRRYFGSGAGVHAEGKTLTHLMGNWLGLRDLYGTFWPCESDGVPDTPPHNAPNVGDPMPTRHSNCLGYPRAMVMNFMDDTNDKNMYMFTRGQVQRMRYFLEKGQRNAYVKK